MAPKPTNFGFKLIEEITTVRIKTLSSKGPEGLGKEEWKKEALSPDYACYGQRRE